jgi:hypothetical protein
MENASSGFFGILRGTAERTAHPARGNGAPDRPSLRTLSTSRRVCSEIAARMSLSIFR